MAYDFNDLCERVTSLAPMPGLPPRPKAVGLGFSSQASSLGGRDAVAHAMTHDVHEGGTDRTRWDEFSRIAGAFIRDTRTGSVPSIEVAREMTFAWMQAKMKPAWDQTRFDREFMALVNHDLKAKGPMLAAEARREVRQVKSIDVSAYRLDTLTAGDPPLRKWLVLNAFPLGIAALLFGTGGLGKSFAAAELCIAVGTRGTGIMNTKCFLGEVTKEAYGAAVFLTLEDDKDEIHRRTQALDPENRRAGAPVYILPVLNIPGFDVTMVEQRGREAALTEFAKAGLSELLDSISAHAGLPVRLLVLDPAGDLIASSEDEASGPKLMMRILREIAAKHGCTILLLGHTPKGVGDAAAVVERGMRGSSAWVANSRAAVGLWAPNEHEAAAFLRRIDVEVTPIAIARVVFGRFTKANHPGAPAGTLKFLRDPKSGRLQNYTDRDRAERSDEAGAAMDALIASVQEAAELDAPYQAAGGAGLYKRRSDLPAPLNSWGQKKLERLAASALSEGRLVKARGAGSSMPVWLDVPGGPWARGEGMETALGSLANLRANRARSDRVASGQAS